MAGGIIIGKADPKRFNVYKAGNSNEVLKESPVNAPPKKFSLSGILGLNQTVELNSNQKKTENWGKEFFGNSINLLQQQERLISDNRQKELEKAISELQAELAKLTASTDGLEKDVQNTPLRNIPEASDYQINFLVRIKNFIISFRKNINEARNWLSAFNTKRKKRNYYWNTARNKKRGGEQYLMSGEHSSARSVN